MSAKTSERHSDFPTSDLLVPTGLPVRAIFKRRRHPTKPGAAISSWSRNFLDPCGQLALIIRRSTWSHGRETVRPTNMLYDDIIPSDRSAMTTRTRQSFL